MGNRDIAIADDISTIPLPPIKKNRTWSSGTAKAVSSREALFYCENNSGKTLL